LADDAFFHTGGAGEEVLTGGNLSAAVVRIGNTVRRPIGPWTPAVHALLRHLEAVHFDGAPRVHGIDDDGREILDFLPGAMAWPELGALRDEDGLARAGALLRRYHEAVASFVPPPGAEWRFPNMARDAEAWIDDEGTIVCHNDCAAWNLVMGEERWAFIDWDVAGPRPRLWDLAYAIVGMVLLDAQSASAGRVEVLLEGYGVDANERRRMPALVIARIESSIAGMRRRAERGEEPWMSMWNGGHREGWEQMLALARRLLY
jgi:hypothetical protein